jgi:hypothetical protein
MLLADTKGSDCTDDMRIDEMFARGVILRDRADAKRDGPSTLKGGVE